jgi:ADP-ribose pyrophosphatase YjhB (NUDIX family)
MRLQVEAISTIIIARIVIKCDLMGGRMTKNTGRKAAVYATVDVVILTVRDDALQVLLVNRGKPPYLGKRALPGGYLRGGETLDEAALRELEEETSVDGTRLHLVQLRTYSDPERDPRGRVITTAYLALGPNLPIPVAGTDAREAHTGSRSRTF